MDRLLTISPSSELDSSAIPLGPGVYLFKDGNGEILYIGKAKNLRSRVRSYFTQSGQSPKTRRLVPQVRGIDWIVVDTEVDALLLENTLIKQHAPKYNVDLKDAKTYAYIALSREPYPRLLMTRRPSSRLDTFGPYTDGYARRELQRLVVSVFKLRVCKTFPQRACLNFHIGLCTAPCTDYVTQEQYREQVEHARAFLSGKYEQITTMLEAQMRDASSGKDYERALVLRNQLASIRLLTQRQVVDTPRRYDQDVLAFRRVGEKVLVVQLGIRRGVLLGKQHYSVEFAPDVRQAFLKEFYRTHPLPREILLNQPAWSDLGERAALEAYFSTVRGADVTLTVPQSGDERDLVKLAEKNIEVDLEGDGVLVDLQTALNLPTLPRIIECFDVSTLGGDYGVAGMVRFTNGRPDRSHYRRFQVRTVSGQDDCASLHEVVTRRYRRLVDGATPLPDLVVVDGGVGQVGAARDALTSLGLQIPLIGLAKEREEIYLLDDTTPRRFPTESRMMLLLRRIRDATHRFSLRYHRKRRQMRVRDEFS